SARSPSACSSRVTSGGRPARKLRATAASSCWSVTSTTLASPARQVIERAVQRHELPETADSAPVFEASPDRPHLPAPAGHRATLGWLSSRFLFARVVAGQLLVAAAAKSWMSPG